MKQYILFGNKEGDEDATPQQRKMLSFIPSQEETFYTRREVKNKHLLKMLSF